MGILQLASTLGGQASRKLYSDFMPAEPSERYSVTGKPQMTPMRRKLRRALYIFVVNIILGVLAGLIYSAIERPVELANREQSAMLAQKLRARLSPQDFTLALEAFGVDNASLAADIAAYETGTMEDLTYNWDRSGAMFFAFTVATSIGYGSFAPLTPGGRAFTIVYAIFSIPLMLAAFTSLCSVLLRLLAQRLAGRKRDLPVKVFRMMDRNRSGTLSKSETVDALRIMGLGHFSGHRATIEKRKRLEAAWNLSANPSRNSLQLEEFRKFLTVLLPDEDQVLLFVDVISRSYIAIVAMAMFSIFCILSTGMFVYLKRDDGWNWLDSLYFTTMTFLTVGIGDLSPDPNPFSYMVAWVFFTFLGLGFTTSMVQTMADESLNLRAAARINCPTLLGVADRREIEEGVLPTKGVNATRRRRLSAHAIKPNDVLPKGLPPPVSQTANSSSPPPAAHCRPPAAAPGTTASPVRNTMLFQEALEPEISGPKEVVLNAREDDLVRNGGGDDASSDDNDMPQPAARNSISDQALDSVVASQGTSSLVLGPS